MNLNIRRYKIVGTRTLSNYFWALCIFLGSSILFFLGFLSSQTQFFISNVISFFPQGLIMSFYGLIGLFFSIYLNLILFWNIGSGFNEFNKVQRSIRIFRWGFPGKSRRINLYFKFNEIKSLRLERKFSFNTVQSLYLQFKNKTEIPLIQMESKTTYELFEKQAADLAKFLNVTLTFL
uniref:Photosystem I assembly protein Ycf4 n=1 Tax=Codium arabicum TaxID=221038 RepID=A0A386B0P1_CODAR|nr:photosystem I assembly protein Ycf4 [Codium arabicum]AYC65223.1 photosystem I assembly protein Ycf4 [Codium arabicum]